MTNQHSVIALSDLIEQLEADIDRYEISTSEALARAYAAGADQQLEQDAKWLDTTALFSSHLTITPSGDALRQMMRPKPLSLKELNLKHLEVMERDGHYLPEIIADLRRAIESLPS